MRNAPVASEPADKYISRTPAMTILSLKNFSAILILLFFAACGKEDDTDEEIILTGEELLTSHTWESDRFVFKGTEYKNFHWDCEFLEDIEGYRAGDYGRLESQIELSFSNDGYYRRVVSLSTYSKCSSCADYTLEHTTKDTLLAQYLSHENKIYFGTRNHPAQFFHYVEYTSNEEIRLLEFYNVFEVDSQSICYFNENELEANRQYHLDVIFQPKKIDE